VLLVDPVEDGLNVKLGVWEALRTNHSLENFISVSLTLIIDNTWAINEVDALGKGDVLPDLGLTWDWSDLAACLLHQRVDHGRFADVRVADETN